MSRDTTRAEVLAVLKSIAPEVEDADLDPARPLREQVDLDSMDWLNVILALHERLRVDIPEADYAKLTSLDAMVTYLDGKRGA